MYVPDNYDMFRTYDYEQQRRVKKLPRCSHCDEHITDDTAFYIEGEWICEDCMNQFRKVVEDES